MRILTLLLLAPAVALAAPKRSPSHQALWVQCLLHSADPTNPWALAHGMTALGKDFAAADGRKAAEVIVSDFLQKVDEPKAGPWSFHRYGADGTPIEPHTNLITKTFVQAGMKDAQKLRAKAGPLTVGELVKSAMRSFRHTPRSEAYWQDAGWTLDLFASRLTPKKATFVNGEGQKVDFNEVMDDALAYLELAQKELAEGMDQGQPQVPKRKQGIYAHACGGLHLFQAVAHWARFPEVKKRWGKRFERQVAVLFYRLGSEQQQYEAALGQAPQYRVQLLAQMLKFYGHFLETTGRMKQEGVLKVTPAQRREVEKARALLDWTTRELQKTGVLDKLDELAESHPQVRLDLIGDGCHAASGLQRWR